MPIAKQAVSFQSRTGCGFIFNVSAEQLHGSAVIKRRLNCKTDGKVTMTTQSSKK